MKRRYLFRSLTGMLALPLLHGCATVVAPAASDGQAQLLGVRMSQSSKRTRIVLDMTQPVHYRAFALTNPGRAVFDMETLRYAPGVLTQPFQSDKWLSAIRIGSHGKDLRLVLDLHAAADVNAFVLPAQDSSPYRLVIDITAGTLTGIEKSIAAPSKRFVVAIDPGHGGRDPGAIGPNNTREKDVVLRIAKRLQALVNNTDGMYAVLTRNGDYAVPLRRRIEIAEAAGANIFISIHADAAPSRAVSGGSVYMLSNRGASGELARRLAEQENAVDALTIADRGSPVLNDVLLRITQKDTLQASQTLGQHLLTHMNKSLAMHKKAVQRAGFVVLKSPIVPSVLVETAFLSNPAEERLLNRSDHQQKVAAVLLDGIVAYRQRIV